MGIKKLNFVLIKKSLSPMKVYFPHKYQWVATHAINGGKEFVANNILEMVEASIIKLRESIN